MDFQTLSTPSSPEADLFSVPGINTNFHPPMRVGANTPRRRKSSMFMNDHSPFQLASLSRIECQTAESSNIQPSTQMTRLRVVVTPDLNKPLSKPSKASRKAQKMHRAKKESVSRKSHSKVGHSADVLDVNDSPQAESLDLEKHLQDDLEVSKSNLTKSEEQNSNEHETSLINETPSVSPIKRKQKSKKLKEKDVKLLSIRKKKKKKVHSNIRYITNDSNFNDSSTFGPFNDKFGRSYSTLLNWDTGPTMRDFGLDDDLEVQEGKENCTFDEIPIETLEQAKRRESQAIRELNQKMLAEKKMNETKEREKRHRLILKEKEVRMQKKELNEKQRLQPKVANAIISIEDKEILSPRPFSSGTTSPGISNRVTEHMKNIRRKSAQRRMSAMKRPSTTSTALTNLTDIENTNSPVLHQDADPWLDEGYYPEMHQDKTRAMSPISGKIEGRPISGNVFTTGVSENKERRTYSAYPTVIRYNSEVYRQEKAENELMKHIRHIHISERNFKKVNHVRMEKVRAREARVKWEHERKFQFEQTKIQKATVKKDLEERKAKEEMEIAKVREKIQQEKKMKERLREDREFVRNFSCHHNLISKQLIARKIKDERDKTVFELQQVVMKRRQTIEERHEQLQNLMFRELNRKRALATFGNYQLKKNLENVDQRTSIERRKKVQHVKEWEQSKKFTNSELYEDYSILKKKKHKRRLEYKDQNDNMVATPPPPSPKSIRISSPRTTSKRRPYSAIVSNTSEFNISFEEYDAHKDPQRPSSAHAPLKVAEFGD